MKEYMKKLIVENNDELLRLQNRISYLLVELENQNEIIDKMQRHTGRDENIFSPRTANVINEESLKTEKNKGDSIKQEIEYVSTEIEKLFEKQKEYESILIGLSSENSGNQTMDVAEQDIVNENKENSSKQKEPELTETGFVRKEEKLSGYGCTVNNEPLEGEKGKTSTQDENMIKLTESLAEISKSVDLALALLNGDKNKCRSELKRIKRTLKMCIEEIK